MQTGVLFLSLSGCDGGNSNVYVKGLPAVLKGMSRLVCLTGCTKQCHLGRFLVHLFWVGLASNWYIILLFLPFWSLVIFTSLLIILSSQNSCIFFCFFLQCPSCKCFDPWLIECLLSLLESWAPASFPTVF